MIERKQRPRADWTDADLEEISRYAGTLARHWMGRREMAEDVAQEAVLRLLQHWPSVERPRAWLRVVIRRLAMTSLVDERQQISLEATPPLHARSDLWTRERRLDLRRGLQTLNDRQKSLVRMRLEGLLHREIAEIFGWPVNRVGPEVARALKRLRSALEQG
jgi:RNA polymerase sigma factor (sigma-70 family)